jgi:hypothetical protein
MKSILLASLLYSFVCIAEERNLKADLLQGIQDESELASALEGAPETEDSWYLKRTMARTRFKFAYELPIAKLEIVPEIELIWDRPFPEGWTGYRR